MGKKSKRNKPKRPEGVAAAPATARSNNNAGGGSTPSRRQQARSSSASGMRSPFAATTPSEIEATTTPRVVSSDEDDPVKAPKGAACWICLEGPDDDEGNDEPLRRNCACRGDSGFAHLTCLSAMCELSSEEIWMGKKKAGPNTNQLAFGRPWESCVNCKQTYAGKLRRDIALEFARSTEGMVGGLRAFRHITAKSWVTKSVVLNRIIHDASAVSQLASEFDELFELIKACYGAYEITSNNLAMMGLLGYMCDNLKQIEAETNYNYAVFLEMQLRYYQELNGSTVTSGQKELYKKWDRLMNLAIQNREELKGSALYQSPLTRQELERAELQITNQYSQIKKMFRHLAEDDNREDENDLDNEKEMVELSKKLLRANIRAKGEASTDGIQSALQHAQQLMGGSVDNAKPYVIIGLLMKTLKTATQTLGPNHELTRTVRANLDLLLVSNRKGAYNMDPDQNYYAIDSYEEDVDVYIVNIEDWKGTEHEHGPSIAWDPADVILKPGGLISCVNLEKAAHLNGKRGWVAEYDDKTRRHLVKFEDEKIKPCHVKGDNLRVIFFGKESESVREECKKTNDGTGRVPGEASLATNDEDSDDDIPDLC